MPYIYDLDPNYKNLSALLSADKMDVENSTLSASSGAAKIPPDTSNRTILIGLGGTGLKTLNHIKRVIKQRLDPQWDKYVAFLAIDADETELRNAPHLERSEFVLTTNPHITKTVTDGLGSYPKAWRSFVDPKKAQELESYHSDGSGRRRLMGKMKIHYSEGSANKGVDEEIVSKIAALKSNQLAPLTGKAKYEVYIIGSLCGGTCSGGFLEMPALVKKGLNANSMTEVNAMLYLPDTMMSLDEANKKELMANGYASLKELNYYQGLYMRDGHSEVWPYNDGANPEVELKHTDGFFHLPFLIGTVSGGQDNSARIARETIAEFFISILGNVVPEGSEAHLVSAFLSNSMGHIMDKPTHDGFDNNEVEAPESAHEFPKRYGTIGFAQAAAPQEILRAYTVGSACVAAGLLPIDDDERAAREANKDPLLPFLGEKQYISVERLNQQRAEMLKSLTDYMKAFTNAKPFQYSAVIASGDPDWKAVFDGSADDAGVRSQINKYVEKATDTQAIEAMEAAVNREFDKFRDAVKTYVEKNGPMAFWNLYNGTAESAKGSKEPAKGIKEVLQMMVDDQNIATGNPNSWPNYRNLETVKNRLASELKEMGDGALDKVDEAITGRRGRKAGEWLSAYNNMVNARAGEARREFMLKQNGILKKNFVKRVDTLAKQLYAFGKILETMSNGYIANGSKLDDYKTFSEVSDNATEVNIAALNSTAHAWLQQEAKRNARRVEVEGEKVRKALVRSFFEDTTAWLEVDEHRIKTTKEVISLANDEVPLSARDKFDQCLSETISIDLNVSVQNLFTQLNSLHVSYKTYADQIIGELVMKSKPLFHSNRSFNAADRHCYVMYPQNLVKDNPDVVQALKNAAKEQLGTKVGFYGTDFADSIMMYQLVAPFEIYYLNDLEEWEKQYNEWNKSMGNGLHGMSPDVVRQRSDNGEITYTEKTTWYDYPSITYRKDPQKKNEKGELCHEGEVRNKLDKEIINPAMEMGLLYCEKGDDDLYRVYRVRLDDSVTWKLDETLLRKGKDGMYPLGIELIKAVAKQNKKEIADITREVSLAQAGVMSKGHVDENYAWQYARRVLYSHRTMLNHLRDTIEKVQPWHKVVHELNTVEMNKYKPAKMIRLMMANVFRMDDEKMWVLEDEDGEENPIVNMSAKTINRMSHTDPVNYALIEGGFTLYYIYSKLVDKTTDDEVNDALKYAKDVLAEYRDEEVLDEATANTQSVMKTETAAIVEMGADLENPDKKPLKTFVGKMKVLLDVDDDAQAAEMCTELCEFYSKLKFWKRV